MARKKRTDQASKTPSEPFDIDINIVKDLMRTLKGLSPKEVMEMMKSLPSKNIRDLAIPIAVPSNYTKARSLLMDADPENEPMLASKIAKEAIALCPECVEAYMVLGEVEANPAKVAEYYRSAADLGKWMIDATPLSDGSTNPVLASYLSYRMQMSDHLWHYGQRVESVEHLFEASQLDPFDHSEWYPRLTFRLLDLGWDDELKEVVTKFEGPRMITSESLLKAMVYFRDHGDCEESRKSIFECQDSNPVLIDYLLGDSSIPLELNLETNLPEDVEEAIGLSQVVLPVVRSSPGFLRWARETLNYRRKDRPPTKEDREYDLSMVLQLPQTEESWFVDLRKIERVWLLFIYSVEEQDPVRIESFERKPSGSILWEVMLDTMRDPKGDARRPRRIVVKSETLSKSWKKRTEKLGVTCETDPNVAIPEDVLNSFFDLVARTEEPFEIDEEVFDQIESLPQYDACWIVGLFQPPLWITDGATPRRPYVVIVLDVSTGMIVMQDMEDEKSDEFVAKAILKGILHPLEPSLEPHKPAEILFHSNVHMDEIGEIFEGLEISCRKAEEEEEEQLEECVESLIRSISGPEGKTSLLDSEGMTHEDLGQLFQSVARFWKVAPWKTVPGDRPIELKSPLFESKTWYAVIVGQLGMNLGVVLYDRREAMSAILDSKNRISEPDGVFLNFLEKFEIPAIDLWLQEKYGWQIAAEDAYPLIERALPKLQHRRPTRSELIALDVALKILPPFVSRPESRETFKLPISCFADRAEVEARWL